MEEVKLKRKKLSEDIASVEKRIEETPEGPDRDSLADELSRLQRRRDRLDKVIIGRESKVNDHE